MSERPPDWRLRRLSTPRAAAFAGVLFAVLFGTALVLIKTAMPEGGQPGSQWIDGANGKLMVASKLMPFAGIAFLWFIGVIRDRVGRREDRFFATIFMGSGILFVGMMFVAAAVAGGLIATAGSRHAGSPNTGILALGRNVTEALLAVYSVRMEAVFAITPRAGRIRGRRSSI